MPGLWKAWKAKGRLPTLPTSPWKSRQKAARFPHSHSSGDEGGWKSGKPKAGFPLSHRLDSSLSKEQNRSAGGIRPLPAWALRSATMVPFCSAAVGNFHSSLDIVSKQGEDGGWSTSSIVIKTWKRRDGIVVVARPELHRGARRFAFLFPANASVPPMMNRSSPGESFETRA